MKIGPEKRISVCTSRFILKCAIETATKLTAISRKRKIVGVIFPLAISLSGAPSDLGCHLIAETNFRRRVAQMNSVALENIFKIAGPRLDLPQRRFTLLRLREHRADLDHALDEMADFDN